ncbi:hypothetical protein RN001_006702 [Aquatica leii]|uniref:Uncharacterized protein n=1 Tax=Aquatica leii TaxID=1421715 RepID=A0AAN7QL72_9COLE|nr:hypothetical protein RN001_006702 [Aquatica leii]
MKTFSITVSAYYLHRQRTPCLAIVLLSRAKRRRRVAKIKRIWVRQWIRNREHSGIDNNLLQELRVGDEVFYKNFLRMSAADFDYLLAKVTPFIARKDTHMRQAITPTERLTLTLRYLATDAISERQFRGFI